MYSYLKIKSAITSPTLLGKQKNKIFTHHQDLGEHAGLMCSLTGFHPSDCRCFLLLIYAFLQNLHNLYMHAVQQYVQICGHTLHALFPPPHSIQTHSPLQLSQRVPHCVLHFFLARFKHLLFQTC